MRRRLVSLALVATASAAALAPCLALAGDAAVRLPWDGFAVGSYVHMRSTTTMSVEGAPPQTSEMKQTLVKVTDEAYTIKYETKVGEEWMGSELAYPRKATGAAAEVQAPKPEELGDENVAVDGKDYPCKKVRFTAQGMTTTTWTHATEGVLKTETKGPGTESSTVVTKLSTKLKVATKELDVRETLRVSKGAGGETKVTDWDSKSVPGGTVRSETATEMGGMKTTIVTEVIAFEAK